MARSKAEGDRLYKLRLRSRLRRNRRNRCLVCWVRDGLQWAHRHPTGLLGRSRGSRDQLRDVRDHGRAYALLCEKCHKLFDGGILFPPSRGRGWRCRIASRIEVQTALWMSHYVQDGYLIGGARISPDIQYRVEAREMLRAILGEGSVP